MLMKLLFAMLLTLSSIAAAHAPLGPSSFYSESAVVNHALEHSLSLYSNKNPSPTDRFKLNYESLDYSISGVYELRHLKKFFVDLYRRSVRRANGKREFFEIEKLIQIEMRKYSFIDTEREMDLLVYVMHYEDSINPQGEYLTEVLGGSLEDEEEVFSFSESDAVKTWRQAFPAGLFLHNYLAQSFHIGTFTDKELSAFVIAKPWHKNSYKIAEIFKDGHHTIYKQEGDELALWRDPRKWKQAINYFDLAFELRPLDVDTFLDVW